MNKKSILILVIPVAMMLLAIVAFRSGWIMKSTDAKNEETINTPALQGMADGFAAAGILPPESGYEEFTHENRGLVRLQYIKGRPAVVSPGEDGEFETKNDIVIHYQINQTANKPSHRTAGNRADAVPSGR